MPQINKINIINLYRGFEELFFFLKILSQKKMINNKPKNIFF